MDLSKPKLLFFPSDSPRLLEISRHESARQYMQFPVSREVDWLEQLQNEECQVAIVYIDKFSVSQLKESINTREFNNTEFIFLSDGSPNKLLDEMMLNGAGYHFREPFELEAIFECLQDIADEFSESAVQATKIKTSDLDQFGLLVGSAKVMRKLYRSVRKVARADLNVMITGESGSGKELVANTVHMFSEFSEGPFIAVNCGAISPELVDSELFGHVKGSFTGAVKEHQGVFELAENGTLFLDEVTEMPLEHQVKLLRVLESREYRAVGGTKVRKTNARIIAATNREPLEAVEAGLFREDLYFRLAQFPIAVPPLRQRGDDIVGLAKHFLAYRNAHQGSHKQITEEALRKIAEHNWPGNVRELKHSIERAYILSEDVIEAGHIVIDTLPETVDSALAVPTGVPLEEIEKQAIVQTLEENEGNKTETAEQLGVSVKTLYNKLEKYQDK